MRTGSTFGRNSRVAVLLVVAVTSSFARAQNAEFSKVVEPTNVEEASTRSPAGAVWLSVGPTALVSAVGGGLLAANSRSAKLAGVVTLGTGLVFGPSVGQWYSERWIRATLFTLGRAAATSLVISGYFLMAFDRTSWCDGDDRSSCPRGNGAGGIAMMAIGGTALVALTVWDIVDSYSSAKKYNEEHAKKSISLSPFVVPSSGRSGENGMAYGLAVAGRF